MSFPTYDSYRDSGIRWLGSVPSGWTAKAIKHCFSVVGGSTPKSEVEEFWDGDHVWVTPADLSGLSGFGIIDSARRITDAGLESCGTNLVPPGSIVLSTRAPIGSLAIAGTSLCTNQGCKSLVPKPGVVPRYFAYVLSIAGEELNLRGRGTTFLELSADALGAFEVVVPTTKEQADIATFLDREIAKIDALVEEQKRLIELLKEKRRAVISQAVTKGLDPNVPMKDSGVEWLGEVPAHWEVAPIKSFGWLKGGAGFPHDEQGIDGEELNFFKVAALGGGSSGVIDQAEHTISRSTAKRLGAYVFPSGTVVFAKVGAALLLGRVRQLSADACIDNNMMGIIPHENTDADFLRLAMSLVRFDLIANPGAVPSLNEGQIGSFRLAKPPVAAQLAIATFVRDTTAEIDALTEQAQRGVELLLERRSALISAAVTGKIDVRGLVPQPEATPA